MKKDEKGKLLIEGNTISGTSDDIVNHLKKATDSLGGGKKNAFPFEITKASIVDDLCNYSYEIIEGDGLGDTHDVKGKGIIMDDMQNAFVELNVHFATLDDVFKHNGIEITDIDLLRNHDLTFLYNVHGLAIKGSKESDSVVLMGTKHSHTAHGRIKWETPKIPMDNLSFYKWYNELKVAVDRVRLEVALYKNGKYTPVEEPEDKENAKQTKIEFGKGDAHDDKNEDEF